MGILDALRHENHLIDSLDDAIAHARSHAIPVVYP
jgi:SulP family sulfate permease